MKKIEQIMSKIPYVRRFVPDIKIASSHIKNQRKSKKKGLNFGKRKYYIIHFDDPMHSGWTVWERVVLYQSIYAVRHGMIPVVDMKNYPSIYQENEMMGKENTWEKYYRQPMDVAVETAYESNDYIISDGSQEWFNYIRRAPHGLKVSEDELRRDYSKYIRLTAHTLEVLECNYNEMFPEGENSEGKRLIGIVLRGTDYKLYHHPIQPDVKVVADLAKQKFMEFNCDYFYVATEDCDLYNQISELLPKGKTLSYKAGIVSGISGCVGDYIRTKTDADQAAIDYLSVLYNINKCIALIGGACGATDVAKFKRNPQYEYLNIIELHGNY